MAASEVKESSPKTHGKLKQNNSAIVYLDIYNSRLLTVTVSTGRTRVLSFINRKVVYICSKGWRYIVDISEGN